MRTKIYTKGGDKGETSLFGGPRVSKANPQLEAYGHVDELNAFMGLCISQIKISSLDQSAVLSICEHLEKAQNELFAIGSHLACADDKLRSKLPSLSELLPKEFEKQIDAMTDILPELHEFILPGGHIAASTLHAARTICRRAERAVVGFYSTHQSDSEIKNQIILFLNRLSDYLFVAARLANFINHFPEIKWRKS